METLTTRKVPILTGEWEIIDLTNPAPPDKCPHCSAAWNDFEKQRNECLSCGFPDPWDSITDDDIHD
jgi:hypothetical protein